MALHPRPLDRFPRLLPPPGCGLRPHWRRALALVILLLGAAGFSLAAEETSSVALFPLSEVRPGLAAVGLTVFEGEEVEEFPLEILGVYENLVGPGQDVILARLL
ncbi:MAG: hypothetical protein V3U98_10385, partial [Acidobacteriota bacterium]